MARRLSKTSGFPRWPPVVGGFVVLLLVGCAPDRILSSVAVSSHQAAPVVPLSDLGPGYYLGQFQGGLYEGGSNAVPSDHAAIGVARRSIIVPRLTNGAPSPNGRYVLLALGMSNTSLEWCNSSSSCTSYSLMGQAAADPAVNHTALVLVNGAQSGADAVEWENASGSRYNAAKKRLTASGVSEAQVAAIWLKMANNQCAPALPNADADAYRLKVTLSRILRAIGTRYPNVEQVFVSSRIYGGYAGNPQDCRAEPFAYETGFAVKWIIACQVEQRRGGAVDPQCGDLITTAPFVAWAPYLWADGTNPRSDGLTWLFSDFRQPDGIHPVEGGVTKVAGQLLSFFKSSEFTRCWFLAGATC